MNYELKVDQIKWNGNIARIRLVQIWNGRFICDQYFLFGPVRLVQTRSHRIVKDFSRDPSTVFAALVTPGAIKTWWSASAAIVIPRQGGIWCATWGDDVDNPEYISAAKFKVYEQDAQIRLHKYQYVSPEGGLPFEADLETSFSVEAIEGGTQLTVEQTGFPIASVADEFYEGCRVGWQQTLDSLASFLNSTSQSR